MQRAKLLAKLHKAWWASFIYLLVPIGNGIYTGEWLTGTMHPALFALHLFIVISWATLDMVVFPKYRVAYELWTIYKDHPFHNNTRSLAAVYNKVKAGKRLVRVFTIEPITIFVFGWPWKRELEFLLHESEE